MKTFEYTAELSIKIGENIWYETIKAIDYYDAIEILETLYPKAFIRNIKINNLHKNINNSELLNILNNKYKTEYKNAIVGIMNDIINNNKYYNYFHYFINSHHTLKQELSDILFNNNVLNYKHDYSLYDSITLYSAIKYNLKPIINQYQNEIKPIKITKFK